MAKIEPTIALKIDGLEAMKEKAEELLETLKKATSLADEIADMEVKVTTIQY